MALLSCKSEKEILEVETPESYTMLLEPGKYMIYRLDSTVFVEAGRKEELHSYQEKHIVDASFLDNMGRTSYKIYRYLRDVDGTKPWAPAGTYVITPLANSIEVIENNMRVIKLTTPIREGHTWKGNSHLVSEPYSYLYSFSNDNNMNEWEFTYETTNDIFKYGQQDLAGVVKVVQNDERLTLDTIDVKNNEAIITFDANDEENNGGVWLRGIAADTIRITAERPTFGNERLTIYNRTEKPATLNGIVIPSNLALSFEFSNEKWNYPNTMPVINNRTFIQKGVSVAFITGNPTDKITVDVTNADPRQTQTITIYNKTSKEAYANFNTTLNNVSIPPGKGRIYEYKENAWRLFENRDEVIEKDPYISELPFGNTTYGMEKYAKGIGMLYQELLLWEYQNNPDGTPYKVGFGVKRSLLEHN